MGRGPSGSSLAARFRQRRKSPVRKLIERLWPRRPERAIRQRFRPGRAAEPADPTQQIVRSAPAWLVSMGVHCLIIIVLGMCSLHKILQQASVIQVQYAEELGEQLIDDSFALDQLEPVEMTDSLMPENVTEVFDPLAATPKLDTTLLGPSPNIQIEAPSIRSALTGRGERLRRALLGKYGGTETTEAAVRRGLQWLARQQNRKDGSWSLSGPYRDGAQTDNPCAATAMALLAFQGAGNTHREGEFAEHVQRGMAALLAMQKEDGDFYVGNVPNHHLYSHAQATIAVCELYGMTKDEQLREPAERAIRFCIQAQSPKGGWKYYPRLNSDTSVTGWYVMALQSALMAGLEVPQETLDNIMKFLDTVQRKDGARYVYENKSIWEVTPVMTAEGLLCRQYLGWRQDDPRLIDGARYVLAHPIDPRNDHNVYYWYYATQLMHHMEGEYWNEWNAVMRQEVPRLQARSGREAGSWDPKPDRWCGIKYGGGRLYTTCMCIYVLEVYYRHLPIYSYRKADRAQSSTPQFPAALP